ncbi:MAG: PilZ domain-containing protein [Jatrophihabitantaceae bacterium]
MTIIDLDGHEFCSRVEGVEDAGDGVLVLARPLTLPLEHQFDFGRPLFVSWPDPEGLTEATVTLVGTRMREHLGLWVTEVIEVHRHQRRQFVRVPALGPIELVSSGGEPGAPFPHVAGHLVDISEAALRCALQAPDAEALTQVSGLLVSFALDGDRFTLPATLLRTEPSRKDYLVTECVLTFSIDDREAAELRRRVFQEQVKIRRAERRTETGTVVGLR